MSSDRERAQEIAEKYGLGWTDGDAFKITPDKIAALLEMAAEVRKQCGEAVFNRAEGVSMTEQEIRQDERERIARHFEAYSKRSQFNPQTVAEILRGELKRDVDAVTEEAKPEPANG